MVCRVAPASAADSGFVQFVLLGASNDTIAFTIFHTPNTPVTTYTRFSMPVNYLSSGTPALSYWILSASDGVNPVVNSSLLIDDLDLVFNTTGLSDPEDNTSAAGPLNNLAGNELYVFNETTGILNFELTDVSGRVVFRKAMEPGNEVYDVSGFKGGFYFYRIYSSGTELISSGKILKY